MLELCYLKLLNVADKSVIMLDVSCMYVMVLFVFIFCIGVSNS